MKKLKLGVIGYGCRGRSMMRLLMTMPDVEITAVCDEYADRTEAAAAAAEAQYGRRPFASVNYRDLLAQASLDAVYVATSWETHVEIATDALEAGIPTALEVGGAYSLESLWSMVRMQERTGRRW